MHARTSSRVPHLFNGAGRRHQPAKRHGVRSFVREHPVLGTAIGAAAVGAVALIAKRRRTAHED